MSTKLLRSLSSLLFLFQIPCFAALERSLSPSTKVANISNKSHLSCDICLKELKPDAPNPKLGLKAFNLRRQLFDNFIGEIESQLTEKIIPNEIKKLCEKFCTRIVPCDCIMKEFCQIFSQLDNNEDRKKAIKLLSTYKIEEAKNEKGITIFHQACRRDYSGIVRLLIYFNANMEIKCNKGSTPLHYACSCKSIFSMKILLENGVNVNAKTNLGSTALHLASLNGYIDYVKLLVESKASVNATNKFGSTPLTISIKNGKLEMINVLLASGANIDAADKYGQTSLHKACFYGHIDCVKLLLENGANVNAKNKFGLSALGWSSTRRLEGVIIYWKSKSFANAALKKSVSFSFSFGRLFLEAPNVLPFWKFTRP